MTKPAHRTWYRVAVAADAGIELVAAAGAHLGAAIAAAEAHAGKAAHVVGVAAATDADIPLGEAVGKTPVVSLGALPADVTIASPSFRWPIGVAPALGAPALPEGTAEGYVVRPAEGKRPFVIEAAVARARLGDVLLGFVERLPAADNLEIKVLPHYREPATGPTDVWLTSRINAKKIIAFLDENDAELFGNGHLEIGIYVRAHQATLRLTEHKTIAWIADTDALRGEVTGWLAAAGVGPAPGGTLATVARAAHFHYRGAASRDRRALAELLFRERLRRVATERGARAADTAG